MIFNNTISVLLCIYNGEKFLLEQLESIRTQTLQPDNVFIFDDCSSDSSVEIINNFILKNSLTSSWFLETNTEKKGWNLNFFDSLLKCNGDFIFFCDQDDIWNNDKISIMIEIMQKNKDILVLSGGFETIDSNNILITFFDCVNNIIFDHSINKLSFLDTFYFWHRRNGNTMVISKLIKEQLKYFYSNELFVHDLWASNIASLFNGCYYLNYPLIKYRIHENNSSAKLKYDILTRNDKIILMEKDYNYLKYFYNGIKMINLSLINQNEYFNIIRAISFYKYRIALFKELKLFNIFYLFLYLNIYQKYFSFKEYIVDILEVFKLRKYAKLVKFIFFKFFKYET